MKEQIVAQVAFRLAEPYDIKVSNRQLRFGQCFTVLNTDNKTLSGPHIINRETNIYELSDWFKSKRIYVPVSCLDQKIEVV
ncbi:hypothetical protein [Aquimarina aggregata]|uniref:hypothetical protein n=1 Tax=Aquimarina aggregata TaxID=1642818 RepID=UPI0024907B1E|nr:hypothetical protein [Aquimarina aggregata]